MAFSDIVKFTNKSLLNEASDKVKPQQGPVVIAIVKHISIVVVSLIPILYFSLRSTYVQNDINFFRGFFSEHSLIFFCVGLIASNVINSFMTLKTNFVNIYIIGILCLEILLLIILCLYYMDYRIEMDKELPLYFNNGCIYNAAAFFGSIILVSLNGLLKIKDTQLEGLS